MQPVAGQASLMESSSYYRDMKIRLTPLKLVVAATLALAASNVHAQLSKPFLWDLTKDGKTVTLFGSLHVGKPDFYPVPDTLQRRFDLAKVLAVEADVTLPETQQACSKLAATKESLESVLSAEDFAALTGYIRAASIPENAIQNRKLWLVNLVVLGVVVRQKVLLLHGMVMLELH